MLPTRCDFCGRPFDAVSWGQRTCVACAAKGAPDQGSLDWAQYSRRAKSYWAEAALKLLPSTNFALRAHYESQFGITPKRRPGRPRKEIHGGVR